MRVVFGLLIAASALCAQTPVACVPVTGPPVWVTCENVASSAGSSLNGQPPVGFDLYSPTAGANNYPRLIWFSGCGHRNSFCFWGQGNNDGTAAWTALAQNGYNGQMVNVYIGYVNLAGLGCYTSTSSNTIVVTQQGTNWWPNATWAGQITIVSPTNTNSETLTVVSQSGTGPWTLTLSSTPAGSHTGGVNCAAGTSDFAIISQANLTVIVNSLAELLAYLGHNTATSTAPGNPHQTLLMGASSGATIPPLVNQIGTLAFNSGASNFTLGDFQNTHIQGVVAISGEQDLACTAGYGQFLAISSLFGYVARASSIGQTIGTACVPTGANSSYASALAWSAVSCFPGKSGCSWGTPSGIPAPMYVIDGATDNVVSQWPDQAWVNAAPAYMLAGHTVVAEAGHGADLNSGSGGIISTVSTAWTTSMGFFFSTKQTGSVVSRGSNGGGVM